MRCKYKTNFYYGKKYLHRTTKFLANMKQAKAQNLDFTKPEVQLICELLSKDLPEEEQKRVQKLMALFAIK